MSAVRPPINVKVNRKPGELLSQRLADGSIWLADGEYFGRASDGIVVWLGSETDCASVERYLRAHPTPDCW